MANGNQVPQEPVNKTEEARERVRQQVLGLTGARARSTLGQMGRQFGSDADREAAGIQKPQGAFVPEIDGVPQVGSIQQQTIDNSTALGIAPISKAPLAQQAVNRINTGQSALGQGSIIGSDLGRFMANQQSQAQQTSGILGNAPRGGIQAGPIARADVGPVNLADFDTPMSSEEALKSGHLSQEERRTLFRAQGSKDSALLRQAKNIENKLDRKRRKAVGERKKAIAEQEAIERDKAIRQGDLDDFKAEQKVRLQNDLIRMVSQFDLNTIEGQRDFAESMFKMMQEQNFTAGENKKKADAKAAESTPEAIAGRSEAAEKGRLAAQSGFVDVTTKEEDPITGSGTTKRGKRRVGNAGQAEDGGDEGGQPQSGDPISNTVMNLDQSRLGDLINSPDFGKLTPAVQKQIMDRAKNPQ